MNKHISEAVIKRLPRYYRCMCQLEREGLQRISSQGLSDLTGLTASQIRQDLNCFGGFGQQGYGYKVSELKEELRALLGLGKEMGLIILGAGNIGQALAHYTGFAREGFYVKAMFDINVLSGRTLAQIDILHTDMLEKYLEVNKAEIGVICVPQESAQDIADRLCAAGIKYLWNFTPCVLNVSDEIIVENVNLSDSLYLLSYRINAQSQKIERPGNN